jgi:flagellar protein FlaG
MTEIASNIAAGLAKSTYQTSAQSSVNTTQVATGSSSAPAQGAPVNASATEQAIAAENEKKAQRQEDQSVEQTVEQINDYFQSMGRDLNFKVDDESGRTIITVLDSETKEVIRQIPPEEVLQLAMHLQDLGGFDSTGLAEKV